MIEIYRNKKTVYNFFKKTWKCSSILLLSEQWKYCLISFVSWFLFWFLIAANCVIYMKSIHFCYFVKIMRILGMYATYVLIYNTYYTCSKTLNFNELILNLYDSINFRLKYIGYRFFCLIFFFDGIESTILNFKPAEML